MLEGNDKMLGYIAAISALTINDEDRLKLKVSRLEKENKMVSGWEEKRDEQIEALTKKQEQLETLIQSLIDSGQVKPSKNFSSVYVVFKYFPEYERGCLFFNERYMITFVSFQRYLSLFRGLRFQLLFR